MLSIPFSSLASRGSKPGASFCVQQIVLDERCASAAVVCPASVQLNTGEPLLCTVAPVGGARESLPLHRLLKLCSGQRSPSSPSGSRELNIVLIEIIFSRTVESARVCHQGAVDALWGFNSSFRFDHSAPSDGTGEDRITRGSKGPTNMNNYMFKYGR